jgi:hypothetical protein
MLALETARPKIQKRHLEAAQLLLVAPAKNRWLALLAWL